MKDYRVVCESPILKIKRFDVIKVSGHFTEVEGIIEIKAEKIELISSPINRTSSNNLDLLSESKRNCLRIRHLFIESAQKFFIANNFVSVTSPTIVGDWVKGQTHAFPVQFYNNNCNLTISHMIYHLIFLISGLDKIYEIGPLFRAERPSSPKRLAEFTILDIGLSGTVEDLIFCIENIITFFFNSLINISSYKIHVPKSIYFEKISYAELLSKAKIPQLNGSQINNKTRNFLNSNYESFVWITNFPPQKRPFFVKEEGGSCCDCQLWFKGSMYFAAGGERELIAEILKNKILNEGKSPSDYKFLLDYYEVGLPNIAGIGLGIERFLAVFCGGVAADYIAFPRYNNICMP
jgi:aspartyl-tRNA synthetase